MNNKDFYRAFEDRHRGSRELIKNRLKSYLPFILPLKEIPAEIYPCIDLGCGRGEWLELLQEYGFHVHGVDIDDGMLRASIELGLNVSNKEALAALQELDNNSQFIISGFHIAEHLQFNYLLSIIQESLRVLVPGGLLILETPNPENLLVGAANFYVDPTHQRPLPPLLLAFLPEYAGFNRVKTLYLQEASSLHEQQEIKLIDVLAGASPDYAIVAQKNAESTVLSILDQAFSKEYGLTIGYIAQKFEKFNTDKLDTIDSKIKNIEQEIIRLKAELQDIYLSRSWKITYLLRWIAHQVRILKERGLKSRLKAVAKKAGTPVIQPLILLLSRHPKQRQQLIELSKKMGLHQVLKSFYQKINHTHSTISINSSYYIPYSKPEDLPNTAQTIKAELMAALAKNGVK